MADNLFGNPIPNVTYNNLFGNPIPTVTPTAVSPQVAAQPTATNTAPIIPKVPSPTPAAVLPQSTVTTPAPTVITTDDIRKKTDTNISNLNQLTGQANQVGSEDWRGFGSLSSSGQFNPDPGTSPEKAKEIAGKYGFTLSSAYTASNRLNEITDETETPEMKQLADLNSTLQSDYDNYSSQLNTFKTQSDALFNQQVDNIKATFAARKKQMDEINKSALGAQQLLGARSGRQRYTPEYQSTILSNEEAAGVSRLSDLDAQMNQALMVAQQAKTDQNWQILNKQMDLASNLYSQKRQAIIDLNTLTKERNEELRQQAQAERENNKYIQEQTDRLIGFDAYNSLTVDADGNVLVPENDELESYAIANGYNPSQYISEVKKQAQALDKMNSEERKNELDIQKAQKELAYAGLESTIAEYKQAKDLGYTTAKNISEYIQEKELAKETPTDRLLKSYDAMIKQKEATGSNLKQLPTTDIRNLSEARQLPLVTKSLDEMLDKLNPDNKIFLFGPVTGRLGQLNPYNVEAQSIDDDLRRASQVIGRFMEGGVLRKEDEEKYRKMLPQLTDTPDVARNKLEGVKQLLSDKATQMVNDYITGGYDATDFIGVLSDIGGQGKKYNEIDDYIKTVGADEYGQKLQEMPGNTIEEKRENLLDWINQGDTSGFNQGGGGTPTASTGMRTDRHNNPTAFTTDIAKIAGLKEGVDYVPGDPFSGGKYKTAKLLGDPVDTTIKVIDKIGFYTQSGGQRWTHTAISKAQWDKMSYNQKKNVVKQMYQKEGNQGQLNQYFA